MKRAVVLGARGLLGGYVVDELARHAVEVLACDRATAPLGDEGKLRAAIADGTDLVFNCAAHTDVDGSQRDVALAFEVNALGAENAARAAHRVGATLVHVSTDFVFSGRLARPQDEFDAPEPLSVYARSKRAGELLVDRATDGKCHVVRVEGLYGEGGRNFASKLRALLLAGKKGLRIDDERQVQPTFARSAARALVEIAGTDRFGTWHASCAGATTWHRFASRMAERLGLAVSWEAVPSSSLTLAAERPPNCLLEGRRIAMVGLSPLPAWQESLDQYLAQAAAKGNNP